MRTFAASLAVLGALALGGCDGGGAGRDGGHEHGGDGHDHDHDHDQGRAHVHAAPHGGSLIVLEEEVLNAELLVDASTGAVSLWVLDGHCESPVRVTQKEVALTVNVGGTARTVRLDAVADALTGETVGDTSQFAATDDELRGVASFSGTIQSLSVGGRSFQSVKFEYARSPR